MNKFLLLNAYILNYENYSPITSRLIIYKIHSTIIQSINDLIYLYKYIFCKKKRLFTNFCLEIQKQCEIPSLPLFLMKRKKKIQQNKI